MVGIIIKSILAVLLLLCLLPMPYVYYTIVRLAVTLGMINLCYVDNEEKSFRKFAFFVVIGILFNPLAPVEFERIIWNVFDVILAVFFYSLGGEAI